jgi:hypothetical protein
VSHETSERNDPDKHLMPGNPMDKHSNPALWKLILQIAKDEGVQVVACAASTTPAVSSLFDSQAGLVRGGVDNKGRANLLVMGGMFEECAASGRFAVEQSTVAPVRACATHQAVGARR